jgi:hypothetical protein
MSQIRCPSSVTAIIYAITGPVSQYGLPPETLVRFTKEYMEKPDDPDYDFLLKESN